MKRGKVVFFFWAAGLLVNMAAQGAGGPTAGEERLRRGEILINFKQSPRSKVHDVEGEMVLEAEPAVVWSVLTDYQNWPAIFPDLTACELVEQTPGSARLRVFINNLWPYPDHNFILQITEDMAQGSIAWEMVEGNLRTCYGAVSLRAFSPPQQTRLLFIFNRDPGWFVPRVNADLENRSIVIKRLVGLRREIRRRTQSGREDPSQPQMKSKWWKGPFWWEETPSPSPPEEKESSSDLSSEKDSAPSSPESQTGETISPLP